MAFEAMLLESLVGLGTGKIERIGRSLGVWALKKARDRKLETTIESLSHQKEKMSKRRWLLEVGCDE